MWIFAVEAIGARDDPNLVEAQLSVEDQKEVIIPGEPREVVNQNEVNRSVRMETSALQVSIG